jgi:hypothetical protein
MEADDRPVSAQYLCAISQIARRTGGFVADGASIDALAPAGITQSSAYPARVAPPQSYELTIYEPPAD